MRASCEATMRGYNGERDQQLRAELADLARNGTPQTRESKKIEAELNWQSARLLPLIALAGMIGMAALVGSLSSADATGGYTALVIVMALLFYGVYALNTRHRNAFIALKVAEGMSEADAVRLYVDTYQSG
jgi:amino acid permease